MIGDEEETGDSGPAGVEANVRLDVELVCRADDLTVVVVAVDFGEGFESRGGGIVGVHVVGFGEEP